MVASYKTKYELVKESLITKIHEGVYKVGERFPSQNQLMRSEKISYSTIARVLKELQDDGYIERIKGKGSYVADFSQKSKSSRFKIKMIIAQEYNRYMDGQRSWSINFDITSSVIQEAAVQNIDVERIYFNDYTELPDDIDEPNSFVFLFNYYGYNKKAVDQLQARNIPFIIHGTMNSLAYNFNAVVANVEQGAYDATEALIKAGRKNILFVVPSTPDGWFLPKRRGFEKAMKDNGLACDESNIIGVAYDADKDTYCQGDVYEAFNNYKNEKQEDRLQAVLVFNDIAAVGLIEAIQANGLRVPEDVAVIGFDDNPEFCKQGVPLTTVKYPCQQIGENIVKLMKLLVADPSLHPLVKCVPTEIVYRDSFPQPNN